jgi:hypothetical protein
MKYKESAHVGAQGVRIVATAVEDGLGWIFREKPTTDIGIDGEIEVLDEKRESTGQLLAVQIKSGGSWFKERSVGGWIYRGDIAHLEYWQRYALPVVVVLCNPVTKQCYWAPVLPGSYERLKHGFKLHVPAANRLDKSARTELSRLVKIDITAFGDLCVMAWLHNKYPRKVEFASAFELPRDYHWLDLLAKVDDKIYVIASTYDRLGAFDADDIRENVKWMLSNAEMLSAPMMLCLIANDPKSHDYSADVLDALKPISPESRIRFLLDTQRTPCIREILPDGRIVDEYVGGEALWIYHLLSEDYRVVSAGEKGT